MKLQVPSNSHSTTWKTSKLKSLVSATCFKKLLKFHLKRNTKQPSGQKRVGGPFKNSRPSLQHEFWDTISSDSKKRARYYIFARILYKRHFASSLISSVVKGFSLLAMPAGDCCAEEMMSPPGIPPSPASWVLPVTEILAINSYLEKTRIVKEFWGKQEMRKTFKNRFQKDPVSLPLDERTRELTPLPSSNSTKPIIQICYWS